MVERDLEAALARDLMRHESWLRGVLLRYVGTADVDDVLQDTWVTVLRSPPRAADALPSMLRTVSTRRALQVMRGERRRRRREASAARSIADTPPPEAASSASDRVAAALHALREPYRSTVLMRYYAGLTPREIAARFDLPEATVRTRLHRAMKLLEAELALA